MGRRMSHSHKRANSRNAWFRMDVPKDIRHLAGKTSWQHSLHTAEPNLAAQRCAAWSAHYKGEVIRLRMLAAHEAQQSTDALVDQAFNKLAQFTCSMDLAIAGELQKLASIVRSSWSNAHARAVERQHLGEAWTSLLDPEPVSIPSIDDDEERRRFQLRAEILESNAATSGIVYQELARELLSRGVYEPLYFAISYLPYLVPAIDLSTKAAYDRVAHAYLTRLAEHAFGSWPIGIREALRPVVTSTTNGVAAPAIAATPPAFSAAPPCPAPAHHHTLSEAFSLWRRRKRITGKDKTGDEFAKAIARFEELTGTSMVEAITPAMVRTFISLVEQLPFRPKRAVSVLPLSEQIAVAHAKALPTLSPPTVGKQLTALRAILSVAKDAEWITGNPAQGISVEGAAWEGDERDHFSDEDMQRIYASPLMTDPDACDDTMFWILFLAPFHGSRPGEHCKLKPSEIVQDDGEWVMRFRRDRRIRPTAATNNETRPRRQKTRSSVRDVPIHWILLEAGFVDFARRQRDRGAEWLFDDLEADKYGDRYKYLSRRINDALRKLGIHEPDKSFYSTRHTMKREGRRLRIDHQSLDQLAGHAPVSVGGRYGQGSSTEALKADLDRLEFRSVAWDDVVACAQKRLIRLGITKGGA